MTRSDIVARFMCTKLSPITCAALLAGLMLANAASAGLKHVGTAYKDIVLATDTIPDKTAVAATMLLPEASAFGSVLGDVGLHLLRTDAVPATNLDNRLVSPYSVASTLGVLHAGSDGKTASEIAAIFQPSVRSDNIFGERMRAIKSALGSSNTGIEIALANRIWVDASLAKSVNPDYTKIIREYYGSDETLEKFSDARTSVAAINQWADQATKGKIKEIVTPSSLQTTTRLLATSAIYLKSAWAQPFNSAATRNMPFYPAPGQEISVPTMAGTLRVSQGSYRGLHIVEFPYANKDFALYVAQSNHQSHTLGDLQQNVNGLDIAAWPQMVSPVTAEIYLPKFSIAAQPLSLKEALLSAGMRTAFSDGANFGGIIEKNLIALDNVLHSAAIVVDENGSEASAATAAIARVKSISTEVLPQIHINRPFLFVVMHKPTATPLFIGRISQPKS